MENAADKIDKRQLKTLLRLALKSDLRGSRNPFQSYGQKEIKFPAIIGVLIMKFFIGLVMAAIIWKINDPFFGSLIVNTAVMVFIALTILLEFSNLILSPDDYPVLAPHPVSSKTFFAVKAIHFCGYVSLLAFAIMIGPAIAAGIRFGAWWMGPLTFVSGWATALASALFFVVFYSLMLRVVNRDTMNRVLGYAQLLLITVLYAGYIFFPSAINFVGALNTANLDYPALNLAPPAWYAAWTSLPLHEFRIDRLLGALAGVGALGLLAYFGMARLSTGYALTLTEMVEKQEKSSSVRKSKSMIGSLLDAISTPEDLAVRKLIRAQFKYDNRFKMAILVIVPLTLFYLFLGIKDGNMVIDPFAPIADAKSSGNFLFYFAVAIMPFVVVSSTGYSSSAAASWIFFSSPADRTKLVMSSGHFAILFFCLPYTLLLVAVLGYFFGNYLHSFLHCVVLFLMMVLLVRYNIVLIPRIPFSVPARAGQRQMIYMVAMVVPIALVMGPMFLLAKFGYGGVFGYVGVIAALLVLIALAGLLLKKLIPKRLAKLEYAEMEL